MRPSKILLAFLVCFGCASPFVFADGFNGSYAGEVLVRSLGDSSLVVALDEEGTGAATRLFFVETSRPVEPRSRRVAVPRVQRTGDTLTVTVPREHRVLAFSLGAQSVQEDGGLGELRQK